VSYEPLTVERVEHEGFTSEVLLVGLHLLTVVSPYEMDTEKGEVVVLGSITEVQNPVYTRMFLKVAGYIVRCKALRFVYGLYEPAL